MKILCLYNNPCAIELFDWLKERGHIIVLCSEKLSREWCTNQGFDLAVSYTYRYILTQEILDALGNNVVNLHTSYLPWNRGADPNLWSVLEDTPRGVTLHYMDAKLDHGYIIAQELLGRAKQNDTLRTLYEELDIVAKQLFKKTFEHYILWNEMKKEPIGKGSYHSTKDSMEIKSINGLYDYEIEKLLCIIERSFK